MPKDEPDGEARQQRGGDPWAELTADYQFFIVEEPRDAREALDLRLAAYTQKLSRQIEVPDELDERAWLLAAKHTPSGEIVGAMRLAPRDRGPLECEQFFDLPLRLQRGLAVEITRFSVHPLHRKRPDSLPPVSLGLFRLSADLCRRIDASWVVIASRPEQVETYRWLGFEQTGIKSEYEKLGGAPHELLWHDFQKLGSFDWHGMFEFFGPHDRPEIELVDPLPAPGAWLRRLRRGRAATAGDST